MRRAIFILALCRCAPAGDRDAHERARHIEPVEDAEHVEHAARAGEAGDVGAQVALGRLLLRGSAEVARDVGRARALFLSAEAARPGSAAYELGLMSQSGQGAPADPSAAVRWFEQGVRAGSADAMFMLANAARAGIGMPADPARAVSLYEQAAALEHPEAMQALALAHLHGELGLAVDEVESRRYMAAAGHALQHRHRHP
ncbi:Sel1 repeat-containing protein [Nannocystis exedens]|uniref:Sel1 repeat-containing protein n=1 Tax=Nannocystis exedens TaxID=54 RepID=A0A1I1WK45_9BACT|nr:tetratricopeptide repeat protein [Nannocystis exedens]PCC67793.1 Localization factor PodJL [Nannocystis exedens]SFD95341.1 Sel1 repeat-containing protein [Nannocystis exedens]